METPKIDTGWYGHEGFVIKVGGGTPASNSYFLHRGYACYSSKFFEDKYATLKRAIIEVDFSAEEPDVVYQFAHWLYPKYLPVLVEGNVNPGILETVNRLFVFAEKYWVHELAIECYRKVKMLFAHPAGSGVNCERVKGLYDVHGDRSGMMRTFLLRLMVQRWSAQESDEDVVYLEACCEGDGVFAMEFGREMREHVKYRRGHPFHDRDLEHYFPPPAVDWWGKDGEEEVGGDDEGERTEGSGEKQDKSADPEVPHQNGIVEMETRENVEKGLDDLEANSNDLEKQQPNEITPSEARSSAADLSIDPGRQSDLEKIARDLLGNSVSSTGGDQTHGSSSHSAIETEGRNGNEGGTPASRDPPQQNGTSGARNSFEFDLAVLRTPLTSPHTGEQEDIAAIESATKKPDPKWIEIRVEDFTPRNPVVKPEASLQAMVLERNSATGTGEDAHLNCPIPDSLSSLSSISGGPDDSFHGNMQEPSTPPPVQTAPQPAEPSSQTVRQSSLPPGDARSQAEGQYSYIQENNIRPIRTYFDPYALPRQPPSYPIPLKPAPSVPLKGKDLAAQILGYQAAYPSVQMFIEQYVPDPTHKDLYKVQEILAENQAARFNLSVLKKLFDSADTSSKHEPLPPKEKKRLGRPPKNRKYFPPMVPTTLGLPTPKKRSPVVLKVPPKSDFLAPLDKPPTNGLTIPSNPDTARTTRSWGSEEYQAPRSAQKKGKEKDKGKEREKEVEEPRPRRSMQRQSSGPKDRKRMWDDFKIDD